ncbi:hypothetical protein [Roseimaritima multifibrata]|uniref:hypothetical protein n=1 Tax=Roseimaritima multifibrata TaxID=1930274 RepID=UPI00119DD763|nr:hypothetical protein [Roseimaritima multifibrata]
MLKNPAVCRTGSRRIVMFFEPRVAGFLNDVNLPNSPPENFSGLPVRFTQPEPTTSASSRTFFFASLRCIPTFRIVRKISDLPVKLRIGAKEMRGI